MNCFPIHLFLPIPPCAIGHLPSQISPFPFLFPSLCLFWVSQRNPSPRILFVSKCEISCWPRNPFGRCAFKKITVASYRSFLKSASRNAHFSLRDPWPNGFLGQLLISHFINDNQPSCSSILHLHIF